MTSPGLAEALAVVCASESPVSRADVVGRTGLARATAYRLVDDLLAAGLVETAGKHGAGRRGRPADRLVPTDTVAALGLQVDVDGAAARVVDLRGNVVVDLHERWDLEERDVKTALRAVRLLGKRAVRQLRPGVELCGVGLAVPGVVDSATGRLLVSPNLGWTDVVPAQELRRARLHPTLLVANEADLAARAVAETAPGRRSPLPDFLYVSGGVGVGGAFVVSGQVVAGRRGWGGEVGHVCVDPSGPACACGSTGCLEQCAGWPALAAAAGLDAQAGPTELAALALAGEVRATAALTAAAEGLAVALGGVINVLDVPVVVLGGTFADLADPLIGLLEPRLGRRVLTSRWAPVRVVAAPHDDAPGATGAALCQLSTVLAHPTAWLSRQQA